MRLALTLLAALAGAFLFEQLDLPAGSLLGAVLGAAMVNLATAEGAAELPSSWRFLAFAALGWSIGQSVTRESLEQLRDALPAIAAIVVVLLVTGVVIAVILTRTGALDGPTAYLAASPGALSQMAALADESRADGLLVITVHTVRVITVVLVAPLVIQRLT